MYTVKRHTKTITVSGYVDKYVDVANFLECCRLCPNYNRIWTCPDFNFAAESYWRQFRELDLTAVEILFDEDYAGKHFDKSQMQEINKKSIFVEKQKLTEELLEEEKKHPGSRSLSAGCCDLCGGRCTRPEGLPCRHPEKLRYSIEALGGNVGLTINDLMGLEIEWMEGGILPSKYVLVCGLLRL